MELVQIYENIWNKIAIITNFLAFFLLLFEKVSNFPCGFRSTALVLISCRSIWEAEPKNWGLAQDHNSQKKKAAVAKEKAFQQHISQLEKQLETLSRDQGQDQQPVLNVVGLGKQCCGSGSKLDPDPCS